MAGSRRKKTRRQRTRGGRIIGEGYQGIAFSPPLQCKNERPNVILNTGQASPFTKKSKQYVTKIAAKNVALVEMEASEALRKEVDPYGRFTAPALAICNASRNQTNKNYATRRNNINKRKLNTLIFSRYRGTSIMNIFENAETLSLKQVEQIIVALSNLLINVAIYVNGKAGVLHDDAHPGNIVYDSDTGEASLIDFGYARKIELNPVRVTEDIKKIYQLSILQFFQFGNSPPTTLLMENPSYKEWYKSADILRRNPDATQEMYIESVKDLEHKIITSNVPGEFRKRAISREGSLVNIPALK